MSVWFRFLVSLAVLFFFLPASAQIRITNDFDTWLINNGYGSYDFARDDLGNASYGGRVNPSDPVNNQPVIFIHGNSDSAAGWSSAISYFLGKGYTSAELYATTWGPANPLQTANQYHSYAYISRIRAFIQAVKAYTGASKVDVIGHSMGVTLGRKAIKGGSGNDMLAGGSYNLGGALTSSVDTFVGIAGGNRGLVSCYLSGPTTPTCGNTNGLYPGYLYWGLGPYGVSNILVDLNNFSGYEGTWVFSVWSTVDQVIGYGGLVYGQYTSRIPGQDGEKVFTSMPYGHFNLRDMTGYNLWRMVTVHATN